MKITRDITYNLSFDFSYLQCIIIFWNKCIRKYYLRAYFKDLTFLKLNCLDKFCFCYVILNFLLFVQKTVSRIWLKACLLIARSMSWLFSIPTYHCQTFLTYPREWLLCYCPNMRSCAEMSKFFHRLSALPVMTLISRIPILWILCQMIFTAIWPIESYRQSWCFNWKFLTQPSI